MKIAGKAGKGFTVCCRKKAANSDSYLTLKGSYVQTHKQQLLNLIRNEEGRAHGGNPLERVMSVRENGSANMVISTTNEKLAQRIGRAIRKAFHGEVAYSWSHENRLVRIQWERAA